MNEQQIRAAFQQMYLYIQNLSNHQQALNQRLTYVEQVLAKHLQTPHAKTGSGVQHSAIKEIDMPSSFEEFFNTELKNL